MGEIWSCEEHAVQIMYEKVHASTAAPGKKRKQFQAQTVVQLPVRASVFPESSREARFVDAARLFDFELRFVYTNTVFYFSRRIRHGTSY